AHMAQLIYVAGGSTVYVDNVYFHKLSTGIQDIQSVSNLFKTYPTLADATINVALNHAPSGEPVTLTVSNMLGKEVYNQTVNNQLSGISTIDLPSGLYLISIRTGNVIQTQKVIVRH
ncbi:MAG: T9SS type A sorting domain-containing protein, partial [Chitinophagales bacterium]